jgi:hypothetical protein
MANTVNDVMGVINSPDYGIKNIAGSTKDILAILEGTSNSKGNLHSIVDDVKNLLQKLVDVSTQKKSIEIDEKTSKVNPKNIKDILDETKNIRKSIDNLTKAVITQSVKGSTPAVAKLSDKASQKVANAMIKNINKQNGGLSVIVDAFNSLKSISLKDIIFGNMKFKKISKLFNNAKTNLKNINKEELNNIIKFINSTPELIKSLQKVGWKVNRIIKNNTIKKLKDIFVGKTSLLSLSQMLEKNEKNFDKASKTAKNIEDLISALNKSITKLFIATLLTKISPKSINSLESVVDRLIPLSIKLSENKKHFDAGTKSAKSIATLVGNLLVSSIFLTAASVAAIPAMLGTLVLTGVVKLIIPITKILSKNNKQINKSVNSAILLTAFTGFMTLNSILLAKIAENGTLPLFGAAIVFGVVSINILTFKLLSKTRKYIKKGAISMAIMGASLLLFGIALNKITQATKDVTWKQFSIIAALTGLLGGTIAILGIPAVAPFIILGSIVMGIMGITLIPFSKALAEISNNTKNLKSEQITTVANSITTIGKKIAGLSLLSIPIGIGSVTLSLMTNGLHKFAKTFKALNDIGVIQPKIVQQVLNTLDSVSTFFSKNSLKLKTIRNAKKYKRLLKPFGKTISSLSKLKELGSIPMKLLHQTLNAMNIIANYYINNPIDSKAIKQAKEYKRLLKPFGKTLNYFGKLKEMGGIPLKLVHQTLNAIKTIANYYINNPIEKTAINEAKKYKKILKPFSKTLNYFGKLKEMGGIPLKLVNQTLTAISTISKFYLNQKIGFFGDIKYAVGAKMIDKIVTSFVDNVERLKKLNDIKNIPINEIERIVIAIGNISNLSNIKTSNIISVGNTLSNTLDDVNVVDLNKVQAVTNMFNAFNSINKSDNIINKFTESVKDFTESCKNLMDAMNYNTDAINNIDTSGIINNGSYTNKIKTEDSNTEINSNNNTNKNNGVNILNVEEIARTIAEKINGVLSVDIPDTQVQLLINGTGGNEWTISRY